MRQQAFAFSRQTAFGRADFLVADSNAAALGWVERWPDWPLPAVVLHGPPGAGKTHLAHLWRDSADAVLVAGSSLDGNSLDGNSLDGNSLDGNSLDGNSLDGNSLDGRSPDGRSPDGADFTGLIAQRTPMLAVDDADLVPEARLLHLFNACLEAGGNLLLTAQHAPGIWRPALADLDSRLRAAPAVAIGPPDDALLGAVLAKHFADRQVRVSPDVVAYLVRHMERSLAAAGAIAAALDAAALHDRGPITLALARRMRAAGAVAYLPPDSDPEVT